MSAGEDVSGVNILDMNPQVKDYSLPGTQLDMTMKYKTAANPESPAGGVCESSNPARGAGRNVEAILSDIVTRLERIEEKIDETIYPPESAIKPEFAIHVKKARAEIKKGNGKS
jgi:hypothetical protein